MKNLILLTITLLSVMSCTPNYKSEVDILRNQQDSLLLVINSKNQELEGYLQDIVAIQSNINELTSQEQMLKTKSEGDISKSTKEKILDDIQAIKKSIANNKNKLLSIQSKLKKANLKIEDLEKMIVNLNSELSLRDSSIALLTYTVERLNLKVSSVENSMAEVQRDNEVKSKEITDKTNKLNTAYYAVGTYKSLREKQIISNEGKVFKSKDVNPNYSDDSFTKIDVTNIKEITINNAKDIKLVTIHPMDSYTLTKQEGKITSIQVTNPERFWASSKHLIVVTN